MVTVVKAQLPECCSLCPADADGYFIYLKKPEHAYIKPRCLRCMQHAIASETNRYIQYCTKDHIDILKRYDIYQDVCGFRLRRKFKSVPTRLKILY